MLFTVHWGFVKIEDLKLLSPELQQNIVYIHALSFSLWTFTDSKHGRVPPFFRYLKPDGETQCLSSQINQSIFYCSHRGDIRQNSLSSLYVSRAGKDSKSSKDNRWSWNENCSPQPFCHSPGDLEAPPPSLFAPVSVIHGSYHGPIVYRSIVGTATWVLYTVFKTVTNLFVCFVFQDSLQNRQAQFIAWAHFIRRL